MSASPVEETIRSFPSWHYDFELDGHHTNPGKAAWQEFRVAHFMEPITRRYGGSLAGKRVLDLGCNAGFFALKAVEAGCDFVLGIDAREMHVAQSNLVFETLGVDAARYRFEQANFLDYDYARDAPFDVVLCLGVLYHVNKPIELLETIAAINTDLLVIDTKLSRGRESRVELKRDSLDGLLDAADYELVMVPTAAAVTDMTSLFGYETELLALPELTAEGTGKYRHGVFATFICAKQKDLARAGAFRFQPMTELYEAQTRAKKAASAKTVDRSRRARLKRLVGKVRSQLGSS